MGGEIFEKGTMGLPVGAFAPLTLEKATHVKVFVDVGQLGLANIESINPYTDSRIVADEGHFPWKDKRWRGFDGRKHQCEKYHYEGMKVVMKGIKEGKIVRPILVFNGFRRQDMANFEKDVDWSKIRYQRLDGFKRYMALKELGVKWVPIHVINTWVEGGQGDQPFFL